MKGFEIVIDKEGKATVRAQGFKGPICLEEANRLKEVLKRLGVDLETQEVQLTEEYYETETVKQEGYVYA